MSISDLCNVKKIKAENENLKKLMSPEMQDALNMQNYIDNLNSQIASLKREVDSITTSIQTKNVEYSQICNQINNAKSQLIVTNEKLLMQEFGLYDPVYDFAASDGYKQRLDEVRNRQKELIKNNLAATADNTWTVNGSAAQGAKMVKDTQKLLLRAFNTECDEVIDKAKYNNFDMCVKRITSSRDAISKLGKMIHVSITDQYYQLKIDELHLAYEYRVKKQEEKEAQKEARAAMREAAQVQKEIEEQRKAIDKEQTHYKNALQKLLKQIETSSSPSEDLLQKKAELESQLEAIDKKIKELDYREANQRAGYVYVISNIGAFGENVYKIGMTRRLDPQDRVDELGDASVPFNFDVHAMIFSDDAPALEAALHKAFENRKVNMINQRREFFNVTLDEIKDVIRKNYDKTVEFIDVPEAEQFRETQKIKQHM